MSGRRMAWAVAAWVVCTAAWADEPAQSLPADVADRLHRPLLAQPGQSPFVPMERAFVEPKALNLPTGEKLKTYEVRDRQFVIKRVSKRTNIKTDEERARIHREGLAIYEDDAEALYFRGSGGGGLASNERLIVENCTFVMDYSEGDFEKWDERRCAVYVNGFKEVLVRNCVFISKTTGQQELRRTVGSIVAYDCLRVQVEECYFAGRTTGWRGHVLVFCCGPTSIRNIEVRGLKEGDNWVCGGAVWVATGVGESKLGWMHADEESRMIYPAGPLLVENVYAHDQKGKENNDAIYVQSISPFVVRNCKVDNWREDSLMDVGFRDSGGKGYAGGKLANHGYIGVVENCEFSRGFVKNSVGAGGGLVFRGNVFDDIWLMPYTYDGGAWYVVGNEFRNLTGAIVCGDDGRGGGWGPSMFENGSKLYLYNNLIQARKGAKIPMLLRSKAGASLAGNIVSDYNAYDLDLSQVGVWADDQAGKAQHKTFNDWKALTRGDANSVMGPSLEPFANVAPSTLKLPGGLAMTFGPVRAGLTGPVGLTNAQVRAKGQALCEQVEREYARTRLVLEAEDLKVLDKSGGMKESVEKRSWLGGGAARMLTPAQTGDAISVALPVAQAGRYRLSTTTVTGSGGKYRLLVDGKELGEAFEPAPRSGAVTHGALDLSAGEHTLTYQAVEGLPRMGLDRIALTVYTLDQQQADERADAAREADKARAMQIEKSKIKYAIAELPVTAKTAKAWEYPRKGGGQYRLMEGGAGASISLEIDVPASGEYALATTLTQQADKGKLALAIDGKSVGEPDALGGIVSHGKAHLSAGKHVLTLTIAAVPTAGQTIKIRLDRFELTPQAATQPAAQ